MARDVAATDAYVTSRRERKKVEMLELCAEVGDGLTGRRRRIVGVFTPPLLQQRSDTPCPMLTSSSCFNQGRSPTRSPRCCVTGHAPYWLLWSMRRLMPKGSAWRVMQFDTLRLRLIKIAARVVELKKQIKIHLPSSTPD